MLQRTVVDHTIKIQAGLAHVMANLPSTSLHHTVHLHKSVRIEVNPVEVNELHGASQPIHLR